MAQTYRVREFAALAGVTAKTLRHYDRIGLLRASRTQAGYRVYTGDDLVRVQHIAALKLLGFSLSAIRRVFESGALPLREALRAQRAAARWRNWPDGMRRWVAYTYGMHVTTWERVMELIEAAGAA